MENKEPKENHVIDIKHPKICVADHECYLNTGFNDVPESVALPEIEELIGRRIFGFNDCETISSGSGMHGIFEKVNEIIRRLNKDK